MVTLALTSTIATLPAQLIADFEPLGDASANVCAESYTEAAGYALTYLEYHRSPDGAIVDVRVERWRFDGTASSIERWHDQQLTRAAQDAASALIASTASLPPELVDAIHKLQSDAPGVINRFDGFRSSWIDLTRVGEAEFGWTIHKQFGPDLPRAFPRFRDVLDRIPGVGRTDVLESKAGDSTIELLTPSEEGLVSQTLHLREGRLGELRWRYAKDVAGALERNPFEYTLQVNARDEHQPSLPRRVTLSAKSDHARYRTVHFAIIDRRPLTDNECVWLRNSDAVPPGWPGAIDQVSDEAFGFSSHEDLAKMARSQTDERIRESVTRQNALRAELSFGGGLALLVLAGWLLLRKGASNA